MQYEDTPGRAVEAVAGARPIEVAESVAASGVAMEGVEPVGATFTLPPTYRVASWAVVVVGVLLNLGILAGSAIRSPVEFPAKGYFVAVFSLDGEMNIPTAVSALGLGLCALLLAALRAARMLAGEGFGLHWTVLAIGFVYLAIDEGAALHEQLTQPASQLPFATGFFAWGWVLFAIPAVMVVVLAYIPFVMHLPRGHAIAVVGAGAAYVGGAVVGEMVGSNLAEGDGIWGYPYLAAMTLEEGLEMAGIAVFLVALWSLLERHEPRFGWRARGRE